MVNEKIDKSRLGHLLLDLGEALLLSGAEISRVEDTIQRIGTAYGFKRVNVFVITSCIILTLSDGDGKDWTNTKRITEPSNIDIARIDKLNSISRSCCENLLSLDELADLIDRAMYEAPGNKKQIRNFIGCALVGFSFAIFFGGGILDGVIGIIGGLLVCLLQVFTEKFCPNKVVFNLLSGLVVGTVIMTIAAVFPFINADKVMIGVIMLQIPGIAMTISFSDVITGETISGTLRLIECLMWAVALASGYMLSILIMGSLL